MLYRTDLSALFGSEFEVGTSCYTQLVCIVHVNKLYKLKQLDRNVEDKLKKLVRCAHAQFHVDKARPKLFYGTKNLVRCVHVRFHVDKAGP